MSHITTYEKEGKFCWRANLEGFTESHGGFFDTEHQANAAGKTAAPTMYGPSREQAFLTDSTTTPVQWFGNHVLYR